MKVQGIGWVGFRTGQLEEMEHFFKDVMEMKLEDRDPGLAVFRLPNGTLVDVFGPPTPGGEEWEELSRHFTTGPVPGFWVPDVRASRERLLSHGVELLGKLHVWGDCLTQHFRAPDGTVCEIMTDPKWSFGFKPS